MRRAFDQIETLSRILPTADPTPGTVYGRGGAGLSGEPRPVEYLKPVLDEPGRFGKDPMRIARRLWTSIQHPREPVPSCHVPAVEARFELARSAPHGVFAEERGRDAVSAGQRFTLARTAFAAFLPDVAASASEGISSW
ncbi:hypothetical protein SAMN04487905_11853 [Actinopolyspora xinjiangensis]|uniref:Uncharacterized protein n=1 Tax=Actinopolyspora xinjiangensis TaxID=405564 RepID=A0A1H0WYN3_9ACTN|nr:hypothetical protein SAMN04487905_11853 [Actinopolyspora xinjiangensis]